MIWGLTCTALAAFRPRSTRWVPSISLPATAQRSISNPLKPKDNANDASDSLVESNPLVDEYLKKRQLEEGAAVSKKDKRPARPELRTGSMNKDPSSLFIPEREIPGWDPALPVQEQEALKAKYHARKAAVEAEKEKKLAEMNIDPDPAARVRLERKMVIASVKRHGRRTKAQKIAQTERQSLYKSQALPTSTKKLQKVVNQIAGKTVSEALVQLRFSKKRIARDVLKGLEIAQNEAILARGMGLGNGLRAQKRWEEQRAQTASSLLPPVSHIEEKQGPVKKGMVELKDGSKKVVRDPSEIYIDQVWVGKGQTWKSPEYRARGMVNMLRHRTTSESTTMYVFVSLDSG
jgi:ribosomal protein L22